MCPDEKIVSDSQIETTVPETTTQPDVVVNGKTYTEAQWKTLQNESMQHRLQAKAAQDKLQKILEATGAKDDETPESLKTKLTDERLQVKTLKIENSLTKKASELSVDPVLAMALLKSENMLDDLDVNSATFQADLKEKIKNLVLLYPQIKVSKVTQMGDSNPATRQEGMKGSMNNFIRGL
jgi:competence CoiA-like predicted nuclease